jgi:hypothetical protein
MKFSRQSLRATVLASVVLALTAGAFAQSAAKGRGDTGVAVVAGQKVAIDAKTGKLRQPTKEESRRLGQAMKTMINRSTDGLTVKEHANGMKSVDLQGRFQSVAVAKKNADGTVSERCVTNKSEADAFTKSTAKKTSKRSAQSEVK